MPLTFALGEAFQFDWSEEGLLIGGLFRRIEVSHMKLCASCAFWLVACPSQGHEILFDAHNSWRFDGEASSNGGVLRSNLEFRISTYRTGVSSLPIVINMSKSYCES